MQCKGFLFDLDGTLVDSLPVVERSWCKWADRFSIPHDEVLNFIHGKQAITSLRHFLPGRSEEEIQAEFTLLETVEATDTDGVTALPGAVAMAAMVSVRPVRVMPGRLAAQVEKEKA